MTPKETKLIEIGIGATFILFLLLVVLLVLGGTGGSKTTITNSYNTYTINQAPAYTKPYTVDKRNYVKTYSGEKDYGEYLRYNRWADHKMVETIFGSDIDVFEVYVRNKERGGGYFTVKFYFEDYYGKISRESITHYIASGEKERFVFKDISRDSYKYKRWWYEVLPRTKAPARFYYDEGDYVKRYDGRSSTITYFYSK